MASLDTPRSRDTKSSDSGKRSLWVSGVVCGVATLLFYLVEFYFHSSDHLHPHLADIAQHLTVAFAVGLVSIVGIEINARRRADQELVRLRNEFAEAKLHADRQLELFKEESDQYRKHAEQQLSLFREEFDHYREQVAKDVFNAVLGRVVDESLVREVKYLLGMPFMKSECQYIIRFLKPYGEMSKDYCILRRDLNFVVKNISEKPIEFPVHSSYTTDEDLDAVGWTRPIHLKLSVGGKSIPVEEFLKDPFTLSYGVELKAQESVNIFLRAEEPMSIEASRSFYTQNTPVSGIEVVIENNYPEAIGEVSVKMHHPGWDQADSDIDRSRYSLGRAFLPGQGFEVIWKKANLQIEKAQGIPDRQLPLLSTPPAD